MSPAFATAAACFAAQAVLLLLVLVSLILRGLVAVVRLGRGRVIHVKGSSR